MEGCPIVWLLNDLEKGIVWQLCFPFLPELHCKNSQFLNNIGTLKIKCNGQKQKLGNSILVGEISHLPASVTGFLVSH